MIRFNALCSSLFLLFSAYAFAGGGYLKDVPTDRFKATQLSPYKELYRDLLYFNIMLSQANQRNNHFCLIGYRWPDDSEYALLTWFEGREQFALWEPEEEDNKEKLSMSSLIAWDKLRSIPQWAALNLDGQMGYVNVDSKEYYLFMQLDCQRYGEIIEIPAFARPKDCRNVSPADGLKERLCAAIRVRRP